MIMRGLCMNSSFQLPRVVSEFDAAPVGDEQAGAVGGFDERHDMSSRQSGWVIISGGRQAAAGRAAPGRGTTGQATISRWQ
jgi:hypothetical protein